MSGVRAKFRRLNYKLKHDFLTVENIVLCLAVILCLVWAYQSIVAMTKNWELAETLSERRKELELLTIEVEAAELENEYYKTEEYQELAARKYLDKVLPGEKMIVMPDNSEEAKDKYKVEEQQIEEKDYSNFEKWMMYLFPS